MGYKWKPSKAQKREFAQKMNEDQEFAEAYNARKKKKTEKRRASSKFNYKSAGGSYTPTKHQYNVAIAALQGEYGQITGEQESSCNLLISAFSCKEKTEHDNIHVVNEIFRNKNK